MSIGDGFRLAIGFWIGSFFLLVCVGLFVTLFTPAKNKSAENNNAPP